MKKNLTLFNKYLHLPLITSLVLNALPAYAQGPMCSDLFNTVKAKSTSYKSVDKKKFFKDVQWLLKAQLPDIRRELEKINNVTGSDIEIMQTKAFLNRVADYELDYLNGIEKVNNAVIYGSTNVPLYTLITQVFLVSTFAKDVWFRTPAATRDVYIKIFDLFKQYLPPEYTANIHLITDPSDLAYDQFNRLYVMGQNRSGTKSLRAPSELVILTGNPDTARVMIERNVRNLKKLSKDFPNQKQLFLGFLAGVNPAVVVASAKHNLEKVVEKISFPFLVNGGQDCMNSDVVFVHKDVQKDFSAALLQKMNSLKLTQNSDLTTGLTPLTMTKSFDKLIAYKEKYKKFLINPEATMNTETKQVSPHIFVIPYSEFKNLDIQEHFAPFITIVKYDNEAQLKEASLDPRLQKKAMAALVYGADKMTGDLEQARNIFREAQHFVLTNTHLYEEFEMNMPFGGIGTDTSMSTLVELKPNGEIAVSNKNHALLISKEVEDIFGEKKQSSSEVIEIQKQADNYYPQKTFDRPGTFKDLQNLATQKGLTLVRNMPIGRPSIDTLQLYGVPVVSDKENKSLAGVALHIVSVVDPIKNKHSNLAEKNPLLAPAELLKIVQQNKMEELKLAQSIDPSVMPGVKTHSQFFDPKELHEFELTRKSLIDFINNSNKPLSEKDKVTLENRLYVFVKTYLDLIQRKTQRGAYVKNYGEYASGDMGNGVTSFSTSTKQVVKEFMLWLNQSGYRINEHSFTSTEFQNYLKNRLYSNHTQFVRVLLTNPEQLIIQKKIDLAQTQQGANMEFRVDFMNGVAVNSRMRFGFEHYPEEMKKSMQILNDFFSKAPAVIKALSGGADIAMTANGQWVIFEFNFGGASGTLYPEYYPFEANKIYSKLINKKTHLLKQLERIASKSFAEQNEFLKSIPNEKPVWWKTSINEISQIEWAKELRDFHLAKWSQSSDKAQTVDQIKQNLKELVLGLGSNGNLDFVRLLESADEYISRELNKQ